MITEEPIITQRNGRYVIPVKADFKGRLPGIVHDVSASGATVFVEPLSVVPLNNSWHELEIKEQHEIDRILAELSNLIASHADEITQMVSVLADLDLIFAKARYADSLRATAPAIVPFHQPQASESEDLHPGSTVQLLGARHPLIDPRAVVPIDVTLDDETSVLVITGPNTGGKTVTLKTVGLLTLMVQAGMHIPVDPGSTLSPFENVYADIGDEQSIEQSLSTFSSHLTNIISFLDKVNGQSLVLLDELGAGTDPAEGSALARALLQNACVEFDPNTLSPTYHLTIGLPGRSNAFAIAQHIGLPDRIVSEAKRLVSKDSVRTEDMLADIHRLRIQAAKERSTANTTRVEAVRYTEELRDRMKAIDEERDTILNEARSQSQEEVDGLRKQIRSLRQHLQAAAAPVDGLTAIERAVDELETKLSKPKQVLVQPDPNPQPKRPLRVGDTVYVKQLNALGEVLAISGKEADVQVGSMRTRVALSTLERRKAHRPAQEKPEAVVTTPRVPSPGVRLDLRGLTVEESVQQLDRRLDVASRAGLPWVQIIHGKGSGALRAGVRRFLSSHPLVVSYESAADANGGEGVTVAKLIDL